MLPAPSASRQYARLRDMMVDALHAARGKEKAPVAGRRARGCPGGRLCDEHDCYWHPCARRNPNMTLLSHREGFTPRELTSRVA